MSKTQEAVDAKSDKSQNQETGPETGLKCDSQTSTEPSVTQEVKAYEAQSKDPNSGEVLEDILEEEKLAEMDLKEKREKYGLENEETLKACLRMLDSWIGLYKLRPMDELLKEVLPIAKEKFPELYPRFIQSQAFLRFKQFKFRESINLFKVRVFKETCESLCFLIPKYLYWREQTKQTKTLKLLVKICYLLRTVTFPHYLLPHTCSIFKNWLGHHPSYLRIWDTHTIL